MNKYLSMLLLSLISLPFYKEEENTYTFQVPKTIQGMQYGVYLDEECEIPLLNENEEEYVISVDLNEEQTIEANQEHIYIKQIETVDGYYLDEAIYDLSKDNVFAVYPIRIYYESITYPITYRLYHNDEMIAECKSDKKSEAIKDNEKILYQAGETYTMQQVSTKEYVYHEEQTFTLPLSMNEDFKGSTTIHLKQKEYGSLNVEIKDNKDQVVNDATYQLFLDPKGNEEAKDVKGESTLKNVDSNGNIDWNMEEGTYYLKQVDVSLDYYKDIDLKQVEIKNAQTIHITITPTWIETKLLIQDEDSGEEISGFIQVGKETVKSGESIHLKRGESYELSSKNHQNGYYEPPKRMIEIPETKQFDEVFLFTHSFKVKVSIQDIDTNEYVNGGKYRILSNNQEIMSFTSLKKENIISDLMSGETYVLEEVNTVDGYCANQNITFSIPSYSGDRVIDVFVKKIPYVYLHGTVKDENQNIVTSIMSIYEDSACKKEAIDINGNRIADLNDKRVSIRNGTYYVKLKDIDSHFYENDEVKEITLNHGSSLEKEVNMSVNSIVGKIQIIDEDEKQLNQYTYRIFDELNHVIVSNGNETYIKNILERNKKYYVSLTSIEGKYTYDKDPIELIIPSSLKDTIPSVIIRCNAYMTLHVKQNETLGNTYGLFLDERCESFATDIQGNIAKAKMNDGEICWQLRKGTYYLKEIDHLPNCYPNNSVERIILNTNTWEKTTTFTSDHVELKISLLDEDGKSIEDATYQILDDNGNVLGEFVGSQEKLSTEYLFPATTYTIHEKSKPNGYVSNSIDIVYETPSIKPNAIPCVQVVYEKEKTIAPKLFTKKEETKETSKNTSEYSNLPIGIGIVMICIFIFGFKIIQNRKKSE